jgi:Ca2+:H+ antiporter
MLNLIVKEELGLVVSFSTSILFIVLGKVLLSDLTSYTITVAIFLWVFSIMLWSAFAVVRHADVLAIKLGEPYGTLILTLSVISIEVIMISAIMLTGANNPTLGRDTIFGVLMIALNGLVGLSLLLGGIRHIEQSYNCQGSNSFLAVLIPLSVLGLMLPNYTQSTETGTFSAVQMIFIALATLGMYVAFLGIQTMRHSKFFIFPTEDIDQFGAELDGHGNRVIRSATFHACLLILYMVPIVLLSKKLAVLVDFGIEVVGAPQALGGVLVAILVLTPEGIAALQAALADKLQRSINIGLGSALATIGLTVPAVLAIGMLTNKPVIIGLSPLNSLLLALTLAVTIVNFSSGRSNIIYGLIHLILFCVYVVLIFD